VERLMELNALKKGANIQPCWCQAGPLGPWALWEVIGEGHGGTAIR
jgi:hypothetical protein